MGREEYQRMEEDASPDDGSEKDDAALGDDCGACVSVRKDSASTL